MGQSNPKNPKSQKIKIFYLYIDENNELYNVRTENEYIKNNSLSKERLLYIIKKNQLNLINQHKLVSLLRFNIDLKGSNIEEFMNNKTNENYLSSLKILDTIQFDNSINLLSNFNSIFLIYTNNINNPNNPNNPNNLHNTTKKINIKIKHHKTRRKLT